MGRVENKVAFVTGAARGQGRSHAVRLAEEGADIIAVDVCDQLRTVSYEMSNVEDLAETARLVEKTGRRALTVRADVRSSSQLADAVERGIAEFGGIDIVSANAGIFTMGNAAGTSPDACYPTHEIAEDSWEETIAVNLSGQWRTAKAVIPHMIERGCGGSIIFTSSTAGLRGQPNMAHYNASKFGVIGLMQGLANELGPHMIRVNAVCPTSVATPMTRNEVVYRLFRPDLKAPTFDDAAAGFRGMNILPVAQIDALDVSNAVLYLASDESRYVTGTSMSIDAGSNVLFGVNPRHES